MSWGPGENGTQSQDEAAINMQHDGMESHREVAVICFHGIT